MKRTLALKKDTLTELTAADLGGVVGGAPSHLTCLPCVVRDIVETTMPALPPLPSIDVPCS